MSCAFVDVKTNKRCTNESDAFCETHSQTLQARRLEPQILIEEGICYVVNDGYVCAYMNECKNKPLTRYQFFDLKRKNIPVHPYVELRLTNTKQ